MSRKKIIGINGSASLNSTNLSILNKIGKLFSPEYEFKIISSLIDLPHFQTELTDINVPEEVMKFRNMLLKSDGVIISTPEYIFSIPSILKNAIEWCVSTTVFTNKPVCIITAAASGEKGHEELKLIMKTVQAKLAEETTLLITGAKGKLDKDGNLLDKKIEIKFEEVIKSFQRMIQNQNKIN